MEPQPILTDAPQGDLDDYIFSQVEYRVSER